MSTILVLARRELMELKRNRMVLASMVMMVCVFTWMSSGNTSEWQLLSLAAMIGIYCSYAMSGQTFIGEKISGSIETLFCGPVSNRDIWFGKMLGTLLPSMALSYASVGLSLLIASSRGEEVSFGLPLAMFIVIATPLIIMASTGILGYIQLSFDPRFVRVMSVGVIAAVFSLLTISLSIPAQGSLISWQSFALMGALMLGLLAIPFLLVGRLSKERIVMTGGA